MLIQTVIKINNLVVSQKYSINNIVESVVPYLREKYNYNTFEVALDRRYHNLNNQYTDFGFELVDTLEPDYYLTKHDNRYLKDHFTMNMLAADKTFSSVYSDNKTPHQILFDYNYKTIYDCGQYVFRLEF